MNNVIVNKIVRWIKANPVSVASFVVILVSLGIVFMVLGGMSAAFQKDVEDQARKTTTLEGLSRTAVTIRPVRPGDAEISKTITVNAVAIEELERFYGRIKGEAEAAQDYLLERNREYHRELVPGILPGPVVDGPAKHRFRQAYRNAFVQMLGAFDESNPAAPRLNAGSPPPRVEIEARLAAVDADYAESPSVRPGLAQDESDLRRAEQRQQELRRTKQDTVRDMLHQTAQGIHLYATIPDPALRTFPTGFPFTVAPWSEATVRVEDISIEDLWEGQMSLWIQQDIVRAIALANRVDDPSANVLTSPIKRLIQIRVFPEHVGITPPRPGATQGGQPARGRGGAVASPMQAVTEAIDPNKPIAADFRLSPSGRRSNPLYDVRLAEVKMIVDARQFPDIFDAIHAVNFMTVLEMRMKDVDAHAALREGYVYTGDVVEATMLIESVWLREWTKELMPPSIRVWLGIDRPEGAAPGAGQPAGVIFDDDD